MVWGKTHKLREKPTGEHTVLKPEKMDSAKNLFHNNFNFFFKFTIRLRYETQIFWECDSNCN